MDVDFEDDDLALIETDEAVKLKFPIAVINSVRRKLTVIRAAPDERTLRNWRSLHYEKLSGDRVGQRSIRINKQWRLVFRIDTKCKPSKVTIIEIIDYH